MRSRGSLVEEATSIILDGLCGGVGGARGATVQCRAARECGN